ncbi:hypothetical protein A3D77_03670 [Candidatus Gottesmanbacteria bacterium RIFCSPHIGHO2_02_FULL_39_11]|uniref:DUF948 domain-containing protein n=1 Tax=Candidatus Gottesmanbacteria bacterium RIFCSPHIGHO2_02_FULL_39_11 TaxID=1798382 RepID=A0A1F5ZWZ7_9BACT|nr:MAG: hypothetical protein A3D77_03670 [Candidatus Gottesmanbacteria bacterium RIFCSPHIGHO2_02_FULL_39_11]
MDQTTTILLAVVVLTLTGVLALIGWQVVQILVEVRNMLKKINTMMEQAANFTGNIGKSFQSFSGFGEGIRSAFSLMRLFKKKETSDEK